MMETFSLVQQHRFVGFKVVVIISLLLVTACGAREQQQPTPAATLPPVATVTPVPTATVSPTSTYTPLPPTDTPDTPTATATLPAPTSVPTDTPVPPAPPTDAPTATPLPALEVNETRVIYHDAEVVYDSGIAKYESEISPWLDLLVRLGDTWYGPERQEDDVEATPLPEGYRWETEGSFSSSPNGEAWWTAPGIQGRAHLIGPDGSVLATLELEVEFE